MFAFLQFIANVLILLQTNLAGLATGFLACRFQRQSFLKTRRFVSAQLRVAGENENVVSRTSRKKYRNNSLKCIFPSSTVCPRDVKIVHLQGAEHDQTPLQFTHPPMFVLIVTRHSVKAGYPSLEM